MVKIRSTMLEVNQESIEELGFDWLLGQDLTRLDVDAVLEHRLDRGV